MKDFFRSLKYLKRYRVRLGVGMVCVVLIAGIWGGGLGLLLPGAKILVDPEGLHGWVYRELAQDRLNVSLNRLSMPDSRDFYGRHLKHVLQVAGVKKSDKAFGLKSGDWLVGRVGPDGQVEPLDDQQMVRCLSQLPFEQETTLSVFDSPSGEFRQVLVTPVKDASVLARAQQKVATRTLAWLPEPQNEAQRLPMFIWLLVLVAVLTLIRGFLTFLQEYLVGTAIARGIMDLRCENYTKVLHLPTTFFSEKGATDAMSRFLQDIGELSRGQNLLLGKTLVEPFKAIAVLIMALLFNWQLTLLAVVAGPPSFVLLRKLGKSMHRATRRALQSFSLLLGVLEETLSGIRVVKAYTMEGAERKRFFGVNRQLLKQQYKMERLDAAVGPAIEALGLIFGLVATGLAGYLVFVGLPWFGGKLDPIRFLVWLGMLFALFDPVRKLGKIGPKFKQSDAAAKRVFELLDMVPEKQVKNAPTLPRHCQSILFENVSFRYPSANDDAVKDVTLNIRAGQSIAFVGANGSGKTTLASMLPRLIDPTAGRILIDGQDISQYSIRSLRRQIGLVTQDTVMFHATIGENIAYGLRRPKKEAVLQAAKKAFVDEFVQSLPNGYDTMVGEHGATLSGGQKQRIAIARAVLRDPAILIFDEALSQVDGESEQRIHQTMAEFSKGRTTLMIAHRLQTVLEADLVAVMEHGRIIAKGSHEQLLQSCGTYKALFQNQLQ